jgi:hypothetical protein
MMLKYNKNWLDKPVTISVATNEQRRTIHEIDNNLNKSQPNPRLKLTAKAPGVAVLLAFAFLGYN